MPLAVSAALAIPRRIASSKLTSDVAVSSITLATSAMRLEEGTATLPGAGECRPGRSRVNRYFRRLGDFSKSFSARRSKGEMVNAEKEVFAASTPPDVTSVRAKSSRHGKSTADKWNQ